MINLKGHTVAMHGHMDWTGPALDETQYSVLVRWPSGEEIWVAKEDVVVVTGLEE